MAEELNDPASIGRAAFWRGIAEWIGGYSIEASGYFDTSANTTWIEPVRERRALQEWWDMSRKHDVDRTAVRRDSDLPPPSAKFKL